MKIQYLLVSILLMLFTTQSTVAQSVDNQETAAITLTYGILDPCNIPKSYPRMPASHVVIYCKGHVLLFEDSFSGYSINIVDSGGEIVFQTYLMGENQIELPESLSGEYEIRLIADNYVLSGYISL